MGFVSLFALLPAPLIYGAVFDSACIIWEEKCGVQLNCLAYDTDSLRKRIATLSAVILCMAICCETAIFYYVKGLNIYDDISTQDEAGNNVNSVGASTTSATTSSDYLEMAENRNGFDNTGYEK